MLARSLTVSLRGRGLSNAYPRGTRSVDFARKATLFRHSMNELPMRLPIAEHCMVTMHTPGQQRDLFLSEKSLPDGLTYQPDFITPAEEKSLLGEIQKLPLHEARYKQFTAKRRIVSFGAEYDFDKNELTPSAPLPHFLFPLRDKVSDWLGIAPEQFAHALVSEYRPGTALGWHRDAPNFGVVVGISLGESCRIRFRPYPPTKKREDVLVFNLHPRSAYVLRGNARWRWQHSIPMTKGLRYSITFRTLSGFSSFTRKET